MKNQWYIFFDNQVNWSKSINLFILVIAIIFVLPTHINAQPDKVREFPGKRTEVKADKSTFIIIEQGDFYKTFNKNNYLMIQKSRFEEMKGYNGNAPVKLNNRSFIDTLVLKKIAPHYRSYKGAIPKLIDFTVYLYSGMDGKVSEMSFVYPKESTLPLKVLEKFEEEVLENNLKLEFNKDGFFFKESIWVEYPCNYSIYGMQKRLGVFSK